MIENNLQETYKKKKNVNIKKATALKNVEGLLQRIEQINKDDSLIHYINEVSLFGSILTEKEKLGDIDVFLELKYKEDVFEKTEEYPSYWDYVDYDKKEIYQFLRDGKKSFSFHGYWELEKFLRDFPDFKYKKIYKNKKKYKDYNIPLHLREGFKPLHLRNKI